jgi:hypothetical protein
MRCSGGTDTEVCLGLCCGIFVAKSGLLPSDCQDRSLGAGRQGDPGPRKALRPILGHLALRVSHFDPRKPQALEAQDGISIRAGNGTTSGLESQ